MFKKLVVLSKVMGKKVWDISKDKTMKIYNFTHERPADAGRAVKVWASEGWEYASNNTILSRVLGALVLAKSVDLFRDKKVQEDLEKANEDKIKLAKNVSELENQNKELDKRYKISEDKNQTLRDQNSVLINELRTKDSEWTNCRLELSMVTTEYNNSLGFWRKPIVFKYSKDNLHSKSDSEPAANIK